MKAQEWCARGVHARCGIKGCAQVTPPSGRRVDWRVGKGGACQVRIACGWVCLQSSTNGEQALEVLLREAVMMGEGEEHVLLQGYCCLLGVMHDCACCQLLFVSILTCSPSSRASSFHMAMNVSSRICNTAAQDCHVVQYRWVVQHPVACLSQYQVDLQFHTLS